MSLNIIGYLVFTVIITFIIVVVGKICYKNGNVFVAELIPDQLPLCVQINKILLIGYYLVNIGYAAMTLIDWDTIYTVAQLVDTVAWRIGIIIGILSLLHYFNIFILTTSIQKFIKSL